MSASFLDQYAVLKDQYRAVQSAIGPLRLSKTDLLGLALRKSWHDICLLLGEVREDCRQMRWAYQLLILMALGFAALSILEKIKASYASLSRRGVPTLKLPKGLHRWDYPAVLVEGARQYPNTPYIINDSGYEYVVFPASSFDEIKRLSMDQSSMVDYFTHVYFQGWPFLGKDNSALHKVISSDLTRALPSRVGERQDHAKKAFEKAIGPCPEWKPFPIYSTFQKIVVTMNATSLLGAKLGTDERWLNAVQRFPIAIMVAVFITHAVPRFLRPFISTLVYLPAWFLYWSMTRLLMPKAEQDLRDFQSATLNDGKGSNDAHCKVDKGFPIMAWLMPRYSPKERTLKQIMHDYIVSSFQSTPSTAATLYCMVVDLMTRPELISDLREELSHFMKEGCLPQTQLSELQRLDSFMRESSRYNIFSHCSSYLLLVSHKPRSCIPLRNLAVTLLRRLQTPVQLSLGPILPAGTLICVDAYHITRSPKHWDSPEKFDPLRFYRMRQQPGHAAQHQFASLEFEQPVWGGGTQGCPGRFFASHTIKILLAHLLTRYEVKVVPGSDGVKNRTMPNGTKMPDLGARILIRELKAVT